MSDHNDSRFAAKSIVAGIVGTLLLFSLVQFMSAKSASFADQAELPKADSTQTEYSMRLDDDGVAYAGDIWAPDGGEDGAEGPIDFPEREPTHPEDAFREDVDRYLSSLRRSDVRFNRLKSVPFGEPETITVAIAPPGVDANPTVFLGRNGVIEKHAVPLTTQINAELISLDEDVEIRPRGPIPILLRSDREVVTSWRVTARRTQPFTLQLVLTNRVSVEGRDLADRQPFTRRFEVKVSGWRRALIWAGDLDPVLALLGGFASLAALVAGCYQAYRFFRPATPSRLPEDPPQPM